MSALNHLDLHAVFAASAFAKENDLWCERRPSGDYRYETVGFRFAGFNAGFIEATIHAVASMLPAGAALLADGPFREFVEMSLCVGGCNAAEIADAWANDKSILG